MSDEIVVIAPKTVEETRTLSKELSLSSLMPQALRKKPEDLFAVVLAGSELGLAPMQAVRGIHIIEGKISLSADLMGALVKRSPACEYLRLVETSGTVATYETKRKGDPGPTTVSFTLEQAKLAGLTGKGNWSKFPDAMLRSRALSAICRAVYPDLVLGLYDADSGEITPAEQGGGDLKNQIRAQVTGASSASGTVVDGEVVRTPPEPAWEDRIMGAQSVDDLKALLPEIQALPAEVSALLKPIFIQRKLELTK